MAKEHSKDASLVEELLVIERTMNDQYRQPNRRFDDRIVLRDSSKKTITATHCEIVDQNTGEIHHHAVKIVSQPKAKQNGPRTFSTPSTIWIGDENRDEIRQLRDFLSVARNDLPEAVGHYLVVHLKEGQEATDALYQLIDIASSDGKAEAMLAAIDALGTDPEALRALADLASLNPEPFEVVTATINIARYREVVSALEIMIEEEAMESAFQELLEQNEWLFGTEYSALLELQRATRDQIQDFILRRTTDDYIEIVEIKRPLNARPLFKLDSSHNSYYPSPALAEVLGQVINYIDELDAERETLLRRDKLDTNKIRAKIIIGRDGSDAQTNALRNLNGHLHRIEVITFDQLLKIGRQVLRHLETVIERRQYLDPNWEGEKPPF